MSVDFGQFFPVCGVYLQDLLTEQVYFVAEVMELIAVVTGDSVRLIVCQEIVQAVAHDFGQLGLPGTP